MREESGPNHVARKCEETIEELLAARAVAKTKEDRRPINQRLHNVRSMLRWCKSQAGYVETPSPSDRSSIRQ